MQAPPLQQSCNCSCSAQLPAASPGGHGAWQCTDTLCIWQSVSDDTEMPSELEAFATPPAQWGHDNGNTKLEQEGQGLVQAKAARSEVENSGAPLDQVRQQC